ncbi:MAG: PIG-L family deacetylase [Victivallales bacterium]|nr:PIG-L family deacetylase [Victivallales bacterium]
MSNNKTILVLAGHLDDSILAVGGLLKKFTMAGGKAAVMCLGNGDEGFADIKDRDTCAATFYKEAAEAHKILGIDDFVCHNYSDFAVQENKASYRLCIEAIRRVKPDIILSHYWLEYFQHRAMARLACDSWFQAGWACSADLGAPWQAKSLYHFEVLQSIPEPTHIVDVSDTFEYKLEAWAKFKTGQEHLGQEFERMEARARFHGSKIGVKYAEALTKSNFVPDAVSNPLRDL